jgi:hypothetical protein
MARQNLQVELQQLLQLVLQNSLVSDPLHQRRLPHNQYGMTLSAPM